MSGLDDVLAVDAFGDDTFADDGFRRAAAAGIDAVTTERPTTVDPLGRGNRKRTTLVRFAERPPVVVQLCERRSWLETEATVVRRLRERTTVPVPPVLADGVLDDVAFLVTAYRPGADLHERFATFDRPHRRRLSRAFGRYLAAVHDAFRFDGYGSLTVEDGELSAGATDWDDWFTEYGRSAVAALPSAFDPVRDGLLALFADRAGGESPPARLFPWDFRPGNAIVRDGEVVAVLDWEAPLAAAPALSAAKAEYLVADWYVSDPEPLRTAFVDGYESVREYPTVRPAHRAAVIADSAVDSTGTVTNPGYPERDHEAAVDFHRTALADLL